LAYEKRTIVQGLLQIYSFSLFVDFNVCLILENKRNLVIRDDESSLLLYTFFFLSFCVRSKSSNNRIDFIDLNNSIRRQKKRNKKNPGFQLSSPSDIYIKRVISMFTYSLLHSGVICCLDSFFFRLLNAITRLWLD